MLVPASTGTFHGFVLLVTPASDVNVQPAAPASKPPFDNASGSVSEMRSMRTSSISEAVALTWVTPTKASSRLWPAVTGGSRISS